MKKRITAIVLVLACVLMLAGCGSSTDNTSADLTISAAASLKNVMSEIETKFNEKYPNIKLTFNYGGSGDLQKQIENGSPTNFFISAAQKQMDALEDEGMIETDSRQDLVENKLVLIAPKDSTTVTSIDSLANDDVAIVALGEPSSVPAGQYAEEALKSLNLYDAVSSKAVYAKDVTQVLTYVANGEADAGVVYKTDAISNDNVKIVAEFPADSYTAVVYPMAIIKDSENQDATKKFEEFLTTDEAKQIFENYGFTPVESK
ncbi:MAG: molybdate ABC transporter substrate-binding protein [Eubacteriaceae bacterium]|jgi:molybdate transport system substrate-binding protein